VIRALGYVVTSLETPLPSRAPAVCWAWEWGGAGLGMLQSVVLQAWNWSAAGMLYAATCSC
jgi:hypothetical protein